MTDYRCEAEKWIRHKNGVFDEINSRGLPLVLFGKTPAVSANFLEKINVPVRYICDNDPDKWNTAQWGLGVIDPARLPEMYSGCCVLILVPFEDQIIPQLNQMGIPSTAIFRLDMYFEEQKAGDFFEENKDRAERICSILADDLSKETFNAVLKYRVNRDLNYLPSITLPRHRQYFPDTLGGRRFLDHNEVFVDCGAFVGDTVQAFINMTEGRYRAIHAFEPISENFNAMLDSTKGTKNLFCRQVGIGSGEGIVRFAANDSGSKADSEGETAVRIDSIDRMMSDYDHAVTYIKMDVEGMETEALEGARETIAKHHPKLAICTYHSDADMLRIPELILESDPSYRLYFRHYTHSVVETVCYAI